MLVGGPLFGFASDKYGRKPVLLAASSFTFLVGFGVTFAPNYTTFLIFRFLIGLGIQASRFRHQFQFQHLKCIVFRNHT
ncbi:hypothetical protein BV898_09907 [Hypsibius exemplaris]|uniref:Major facilitator superfamily (MFS) profile domain-containing protein n=1 Tax=Hypsibius exemplaris TaxID=2072580 RepID=A0A1W0WLB2_HYPEX|nr:hypothetical protein BV898_09907 [Hypsibius exemplaris]